MVKARRLVQGASWKRRPGILQARGRGLDGFTLLRDYPRREPTPIARRLKKGTLHREPYEFGMEVKTLELQDAYERLWRGEIVHSPTASALGIAQPGILPIKRATVSRRS
jgi:hypothetical protein